MASGPKLGVSAGQYPGHMDMLTLESCHSTWVFDTNRMRFCRILKETEASQRRTSTEWRPYWYLEVYPDSEVFCVYLNADRSRILRSWRHASHCAQCDSQQTTELSLDDIRRLTSA